MAALLVALSVTSVMISVALPLWSTAIRREREAELVFRGRQYVRAIELFQRRFGGTFPPTIDVLLQGRFLRRRYLDPITRGEFQLLYVGIPASANTSAPSAVTDGRRGILGVVSRSKETSLRLYQGRGRYNEWMFVVQQATTASANEVEPRRLESDGP